MRVMSKLDENLIIDIFQKKFGNKNFVSEDVETIQFGRERIFAKTDTLVQSSDIPQKMGLGDAARKSIVACVSDFAAKGIRPEYGIISVNLPKNTPKKAVKDMAEGFKKASEEFGLSIVGGDTNQGKEIVFNVCIFGKSKKIVTRKDSKKNDLIFVTGPFGYTPLGLKSLLDNTKKQDKVISKSVNYFLKPKPKLDFALKSRKYLSSAMDSSDGLSTTLNTMASQSKKKFTITSLPVKDDIQKHVKTQNQLIDLIFHGGEEYEFAFTINPRHKKKILEIAKSLKTPVMKIGYVSSGRGVHLEQGSKKMILRDRGWKHFR